ncbi:uncharacterized protein LOC113352262 [Papaver somniferum]|uniref:uncharacterized protein LOC113352262 n=1 Tax=Papaver somniferum TaxID=3469 RepID=UPI000E6F7F2E|nr:uncharacterized protein LOC113352262 [Papaver somniferum]
MEEFYKFCSWDWRMNCSFITLVPKKEDSCSPKDYIPLSLLGSAYKVLSKVLANRLKKVMHKLVSEFKGAFIKGKQILDCVLIAGECVDSRMKAKKPVICAKLTWRRWCISSTNISVLVNGSSTEKFKPSKGLRQGDSLSPFLFLLVVEILSKIIDDDVLRRQLNEFEVQEGGIMISHLQFEDDTLLFIDAKGEEIRRLLLILNSFELLTGMKLNLEKSTMISVGADAVIDSLALELGCRVEKLSFKYLGFPIGVTARFTYVWEEMIKRMEVKLATRKKKFLSKSGRLRNALWRRVVQQKLKNEEDVCLPTNDDAALGRSNWKGILKSSEFIDEHVSFKLNNGNSIRFWLDNWETNGTLRSKYPIIYKVCSRKSASIAYMVENHRLQCQMRRTLYHYEQLEYDLLCNELGPIHGLNVDADIVEIMEGFSVNKCYDLLVQGDDAFKICWVFPDTVKKNFESWRVNNLKRKCKEVWWKVIYAVHWHLWKERNNRAFGGRAKDADEVIMFIKQTIVLWFFERDVFKDVSVSQVLFH